VRILPQTLCLAYSRLRQTKGEAAMTPEAKLASMGLSLPDTPKPMANYVPFKISGNTLYLSGQGPRRGDGMMMAGKVGRDVTVEEAYEHAKLVGLGLLAAAKAAAGELSRIEVLKVLGMVNAVPEFTDQPKVINGCSDLFVAVLGERGRHARSAVGMGSLPMNISVEIEAVMRIHDA
jgi:enamine deaminase RidA (YjgF/YER057c/UK114 family)